MFTKVWIVVADTQHLPERELFSGWIVKICPTYEIAEHIIWENHPGYIKVKSGTYRIPGENNFPTLKIFSKEY